jgi:hypothetical protein
MRKSKLKKPRPKKLGGRPKRDHPIDPKTGAIMIRRMPFAFALMLFGPRLAGAEFIRRRKEHCKESGKKFERDIAINDAAAAVGMDPRQLTHWLNRSKNSRSHA